MTRKRSRRRPISIAASLLAHVLLLSPLLCVAPDLRIKSVSSRPDVQIDLVRRPYLSVGAGRPAQPAGTSLIRAKAQRLQRQASTSISSASGPTSTANALTGVTAGPEAGAAGDARVRAALRGALGCLNPDLTQLSAAERAACRDRLRQAATDMGDTTVDPIRSIRKRAYYDEVKDARDAMNSYNPVSGPMPGNGPGFGCKFGKCGVILPRGALTEEWGIKPP
jgi:hypothetical protein